MVHVPGGSASASGRICFFQVCRKKQHRDDTVLVDVFYVDFVRSWLLSMFWSMRCLGWVRGRNPVPLRQWCCFHRATLACHNGLPTVGKLPSDDPGCIQVVARACAAFAKCLLCVSLRKRALRLCSPPACVHPQPTAKLARTSRMLRRERQETPPIERRLPLRRPRRRLRRKPTPARRSGAAVRSMAIWSSPV